jgi:hypothetical protein
MHKGKAQADNEYREEDFFHCILAGMVQGSGSKVQGFGVQGSKVQGSKVQMNLFNFSGCRVKPGMTKLKLNLHIAMASL